MKFAHWLPLVLIPFFFSKDCHWHCVEGSPLHIHGFLLCLPRHSSPQIPILKFTYTQNNPQFYPVLQARIRNLRFNKTTTPKPLVIVAASHDSHVQATVLCARANHLGIRIRSGGHDYEGFSYVSDSPYVILDMFNLRQVDIDLKSETAWVQAGATLGELYYEIANKSNHHAFPAGVGLTVGVGGHITGGGYGTLIRKYGLTVDNVIDAQVVDVRGRILTRRTMGKDLYWAIRGGGAASFCVILGKTKELLDLMDAIFPMQALTHRDCTEMKWVESNLFWNDYPGSTKLDVLLQTIPSSLQFNPSGGKMREILPSDTPFPHRAGNVFKIQYLAEWSEAGVEAEHQYMKAITSLHETFTPYVSSNPREAFLDYRDITIGNNKNGNTSFALDYFKGNVKRLIKVKSKVDPYNFFSSPQSIPVASVR